MKTFFLWTYFILYLVGTIPKRIKLNDLKKKNLKEEYEEFIQKCAYNWGKSVVDAVGININIIGKENIPIGNCLFVSNHQSYADIPVILTVLNKPIGFIAKKEMETLPLVSYWMKEMHSIFMDRQNIRESVKSINQGIETLKQGYSLVIFPEGTRSKCKDIGEFKKGSMKLGIKSEVPIVPISLCGTYKAYEGNNNKFKKTNINVIIHKPIDSTKLSKEEQNNLAETIKNVISSNYKE